MSVARSQAIEERRSPVVDLVDAVSWLPLLPMPTRRAPTIGGGRLLSMVAFTSHLNW
jgi:hypothetical protein